MNRLIHNPCARIGCNNMLLRPEIYRCQRCFHEFNLGHFDYKFAKIRSTSDMWTQSPMIRIKITMDETGEDYTEMMCIRCGKYMDKDLFECPFCDYHYPVIKKYRPRTPTPHFEKSCFVPILETYGQTS